MTHDVTVHVLGATVYDVLKFMVAAFILEGLQKWLNKTGLSKSISGVVQLMVELLLLTFFAYTALQSHQSRGFDNGVLFATDCFLFLSLLIAVIYPLVKKYLPSGMKRIDWSDSNSWGTRASPIGRPVIASSPSKLLQFRAQFNGGGNGSWSRNTDQIFVTGKAGRSEGSETYLLSESGLAKDWLRPEEEEAWQDL